jgi:ribose transport system substrate-binding protein
MRSLRIFGWLAAGLLVGAFGCQRGPSRIKVAFVTNNADEFWVLAERGAQEEADKADVELLFRRPTIGTTAEQKDIIDTLVTQGVNAISISVKDPDNQTDHLDKIARRIPLLAVDNDADKSQRRCYIGTDNVKAGRAVGKLVREAMPGGGVIALFVGQIEPLNARQRCQGVLEELGIKDTVSADGKFRLHRKDPYTDNLDRRQAKDNVAAVLSQLNDEPHVCLIGLWAYNTPAILNVVREREKSRHGKVRIVGFDENLDTLRGIEDGDVYATVVQNPYEFGRKSVRWMAALARGENPPLPPDGKEYVPERIVTRKGGEGRLKAADYRREIEKILGK